MKQPINIGFDAKRAFNNFTGLGNYSRTLLSNLTSFYSNFSCHLFTTKSPKNERTSFLFEKSNFAIHLPPRAAFFWRSLGIIGALKKTKIDIYHGLSHEIPFNIRKTGIKTVVTIHDLIFKTYPSHFPFIDRKIYDLKFKYACKNADLVIAISEHTKKEIIRHYNIDANKIKVIYQACEPMFGIIKAQEERIDVLKKYSLPSKYFLYVGSIIERKNLLTLVKAVEQLPNAFRYPLVVIGDGKDYKRKVVSYIKEKRIDDLIIFPGKIAYEDLPSIYQQADVFIYPSFAEGFGIPIIEALSSKVPVITSNTSCLPEAGGSSSFLIDPNKSESITNAIIEICSDESLSDKMIADGLEYVKKFDGAKVTKELYNAYLDLLR